MVVMSLHFVLTVQLLSLMRIWMPNVSLDKFVQIPLSVFVLTLCLVTINVGLENYAKDGILVTAKLT